MQCKTLAVAAALTLSVAGLGGVALADTNYLRGNSPLITGVVVSVSQQSLVIRNDQGEEIKFVLDSRSLLPNNLKPGARETVEFRAMDNGGFRAVRVTPAATGTVQARPNAPTPRTRMGSTGPAAKGAMGQAKPAPAGSGSKVGAAAPRTTTKTSSEGPAASAGGRAPAADHGPVAYGSEPWQELPKTASPWPRIALAGLILVAAATGLWLARRLRRA